MPYRYPDYTAGGLRRGSSTLPFHLSGAASYIMHSCAKRNGKKRIRPFYGDGLPILPKQEAADIFIFGVIDWRLRIQRPQHLARGLAQSGRRVFYLSTAFVHDRSQGFELEDVGDNACLYVVRLHLPGRPPVYAAPPAAKDLQRLKRDLAEILRWTNSRQIVSVVEHPYWYELAGSLPGSQLIYDCMDRHDGFVHTGTRITSIEQALLGNAEAIIATSQSLYDTARHSNPNTVLIRNAADFDFFSVRPDSVFRDVQERPILGYYGAIADWIDIELLKCVAHRFGDCLLLMIGSDECGARQQLAAFPNVLFTGEVNYANLPHFLYGMDVCLLPFRVNALTLATNPVKVYEYLAAGKLSWQWISQSYRTLNATSRQQPHTSSFERIDAALAVPESSPAEEERRRFFRAEHMAPSRTSIPRGYRLALFSVGQHHYRYVQQPCIDASMSGQHRSLHRLSERRNNHRR